MRRSSMLRMRDDAPEAPDAGLAPAEEDAYMGPGPDDELEY